MYRDRSGGSSKSEMVGGKRINDAQLEKSSASTSRALKDKAVPSTSAVVTGKLHQRHHNNHMDHQRDTSSTLTTKNKCSDG